MNLRMDAMEKQQKRVLLFIGASLLLHLLLLLLLPLTHLLPRNEYKDLADRSVMIDLDQKRFEEFQKNAKQIVETENAQNKEIDKDAKYLSEHDQKVAEQTRSKTVDSFRTGGAGLAKEAATPQKLSLKNLAPTESGLEPLKRAEVEQKQAQLNGGPAGSASNDYLKDLKEGDKTMLSTREFVYFGYYHRIRQKLEQSWNSKLRATLETYLVSGRRLASERDYVTRLVVVLDSHGRITAVKVLEASGARDLDQVAVDAFNSAGPFPDPPKGLIDPDGTIKIRWDFILQS